MTDCSCVTTCIEDGYDDWSEERRVAGTEHVCVECRRVITLGEQYERTWGAYLDQDGEEIESETDTYTTCVDCASACAAFFCDGYYIGRIWDDLGDHLADVVAYGDGVASACMVLLTTRARGRVCDMIEEVWERSEGGDEGVI